MTPIGGLEMRSDVLGEGPFDPRQVAQSDQSRELARFRKRALQAKTIMLESPGAEAILGWHSFSGINTDVWMDDIVLSTSPIGCD